jgi:hypothetical protein
MRTGGIGASVLSDHAPAHPVQLIQQQVYHYPLICVKWMDLFACLSVTIV